MDVNWHSLPVELQTIIFDFALADPESPLTPIADQLDDTDTDFTLRYSEMLLNTFSILQSLLKSYLSTTVSHSCVRTISTPCRVLDQRHHNNPNSYA